jgi:hypothetical protein
MYMPVAPANYGGGFGGFGGADGWWIILLFLFAGGGFGWGGFGGNNGGFMNADIQRGFDQSAIMTGVSGIQNTLTSGFGDLQTALCGGFAGVNANISNGFAQAEIGENARQMANMQQMFGIQSSLQNCCCENRSNIADLKYTVATENCADRAALADGLREVITNQTANTQRILDMMCQDKIDAKNEQILSLQNSLNMANLAASQTAQTQQILAALTTVTPAA